MSVAQGSGWVDGAASLSLVIPAYNEAARLGGTLEALGRWLASGPSPVVEVILVDDGSTDGTARIAAGHELGATPLRVIRLPQNRGKGAAVRAGVQAAVGEDVLFMDADLSTPLAHCAAISAALRTADLAVGARGLPASRVEVARPLHREVMSVVFNGLARGLVGVRATDVLCGFKGFRRDCAVSLFGALRAERFAFDVELFALAHAMGLRVVEVPICWRHEGRSSVQPVAHSLEALMELLGIAVRARSRWWSLRPVVGEGCVHEGAHSKEPADDRHAVSPPS